MLEGSSARRLEENPAKKNIKRNPFLSIHNNETGKTRSLVNNVVNRSPNLRLNSFSKNKEEEITPYKNISNVGNISFSNKRKKELNPAQIFLRKQANKGIRMTENGINFLKTNLIDPYPNEHVNTAGIITGTSSSRNYEEARKIGGFLFPRILGITMLSNYPRTWITTAIEKISRPASKAIFKAKWKIRDTLGAPFYFAKRGVGNIYRKMGEMFSSPEKLKERRLKRNNKRKKTREKFDKIIKSAEKIVNYKFKLPKFKTHN